MPLHANLSLTVVRFPNYYHINKTQRGKETEMQTYTLIRQAMTHGIPVAICIAVFISAYAFMLQGWLKS